MFLTTLLLLSICPQEDEGIDLKLASRYLAEGQAIAAADAGRLWGHSLEGPLLFADRCTRQITANQADAEGRLHEKGDLYFGELPIEVNIANTAIHWAGVEWTMVAWPLPPTFAPRQRLLAHEMFHRIQDEIGFPANNPDNSHLEERDGRLWLRLEWRALAAALRAAGDERKAAIRDALAFQNERHRLIPGAAEAERGLEMNEGLAEYTGYALGGEPRETVAAEVANLLEHLPESGQTLMRSFAYTSGPAYGWLLDAASPEWRTGLQAKHSLADRLGEALDLEPVKASQLWARAKIYDGERVLAEEDARRAKQEQRRSELVAQYVEGPVLVLPLTESMRYSFNPRSLESLGEHGTFYPTLEVSDAWGVLKVDDGALMTADRKDVRVRVPDSVEGSEWTGPGWTLTLKAPWRGAGSKETGYRLTKEK
ncbi:MAG: hypothetical protein RL885_31950 [Planctomycetota bacterium]